MGLSDFITAHAARIASECEVFARSLLPAAEGLDGEALRDHAKEMLMAIAAEMKCPQTPDQQEEKSRGLTQALAGPALTAAQEHGDGRAAQGFTIIQTVAEFRALRAAALRLWLQTSPSLAASHIDELIRFNEGVDQALAESVVRYAGVVARDRNQFLGVLSHELRTPLATILTSTRAQQIAAQQQRLLPETLDRTLRAGRHIQSILDDLLDYVRIGLRGGMRLTPSAFSMDELCKNAIDNLAASHPGRSIEFSASGVMEGVWDENRIFQAMTNLIGNALKYGLPELPVRVTTSETDDGSGVVIEVHNRGPKIPVHT